MTTTRPRERVAGLLLSRTTPSASVDFGHHAIATLVKAMEDHRNEFAGIVAGYEDEM